VERLIFDGVISTGAAGNAPTSPSRKRFSGRPLSANETVTSDQFAPLRGTYSKEREPVAA
jgi:hypothetical protein